MAALDHRGAKHITHSPRISRRGVHTDHHAPAAALPLFTLRQRATANTAFLQAHAAGEAGKPNSPRGSVSFHRLSDSDPPSKTTDSRSTSRNPFLPKAAKSAIISNQASDIITQDNLTKSLHENARHPAHHHSVRHHLTEKAHPDKAKEAAPKRSPVVNENNENHDKLSFRGSKSHVERKHATSPEPSHPPPGTMVHSIHTKTLLKQKMTEIITQNNEPSPDIEEKIDLSVQKPSAVPADLVLKDVEETRGRITSSAPKTVSKVSNLKSAESPPFAFGAVKLRSTNSKASYDIQKAQMIETPPPSSSEPIEKQEELPAAITSAIVLSIVVSDSQGVDVRNGGDLAEPLKTGRMEPAPQMTVLAEHNDSASDGGQPMAEDSAIIEAAQKTREESPITQPAPTEASSAAFVALDLKVRLSVEMAEDLLPKHTDGISPSIVPTSYNDPDDEFKTLQYSHADEQEHSAQFEQMERLNSYAPEEKSDPAITIEVVYQGGETCDFTPPPSVESQSQSFQNENAEASQECVQEVTVASPTLDAPIGEIFVQMEAIYHPTGDASDDAEPSQVSLEKSITVESNSTADQISEHDQAPIDDGNLDSEGDAAEISPTKLAYEREILNTMDDQPETPTGPSYVLESTAPQTRISDQEFKSEDRPEFSSDEHVSPPDDALEVLRFSGSKAISAQETFDLEHEVTSEMREVLNQSKSLQRSEEYTIESPTQERSKFSFSFEEQLEAEMSTEPAEPSTESNAIVPDTPASNDTLSASVPSTVSRPHSAVSLHITVKPAVQRHPVLELSDFDTNDVRTEDASFEEPSATQIAHSASENEQNEVHAQGKKGRRWYHIFRRAKTSETPTNLHTNVREASNDTEEKKKSSFFKNLREKFKKNKGKKIAHSATAEEFGRLKYPKSPMLNRDANRHSLPNYFNNQRDNVFSPEIDISNFESGRYLGDHSKSPMRFIKGFHDDDSVNSSSINREIAPTRLFPNHEPQTLEDSADHMTQPSVNDVVPRQLSIIRTSVTAADQLSDMNQDSANGIDTYVALSSAATDAKEVEVVIEAPRIENMSNSVDENPREEVIIRKPPPVAKKPDGTRLSAFIAQEAHKKKRAISMIGTEVTKASDEEAQSALSNSWSNPVGDSLIRELKIRQAKRKSMQENNHIADEIAIDVEEKAIIPMPKIAGIILAPSFDQPTTITHAPLGREEGRHRVHLRSESLAQRRLPTRRKSSFLLSTVIDESFGFGEPLSDQ